MIASRLLVMIRLSPLVLSHTSALRLPLEEMRRSHVEASVAEKETTASPHPDFPLKAIRNSGPCLHTWELISGVKE